MSMKKSLKKGSIIYNFNKTMIKVYNLHWEDMRDCIDWYRIYLEDNTKDLYEVVKYFSLTVTWSDNIKWKKVFTYWGLGSVLEKYDRNNGIYYKKEKMYIDRQIINLLTEFFNGK